MIPSGVGAGSVRCRCASSSPGTRLPPCLLPNVEGCSCPFPHFSSASKSTVLARKKPFSTNTVKSHLSNIYLASFDKGPGPGRAGGTVLHSDASLRAGSSLPICSCSHSVSSSTSIPAPCLGPRHTPWPEGPRKPARRGWASTETPSPAPRYLSTAATECPCEMRKPKSSSMLNCLSCIFGHRLPDR